MAIAAHEQVSATGDVTVGSAMVKGIVITAGLDVATVVIRDSSGGDPMLTLSVPSNQTFQWRCAGEGLFAATNVHATITGVGATVSFEYEE